jgi:DNA helicase HerA-like ATPase
MSFQLFCQKATDNQLKNILKKEFEADRPDDYAIAREAALRRGWTYEEINTYKTQGGS